MNPNYPGRARRGLSLIETMVSLTVLSVMAAVSLPLIDGATDAYLQSSALRSSTENVAFALDRCVRLLRTIPLAADAQGVAIASVSATAVRFTDGRGLELSGTTLLMRDATGSTAPLCTDVREFELLPLASDGATSTAAQPAATRRFNIKVRTSAVDMRTAAFIRVGALGI